MPDGTIAGLLGAVRPAPRPLGQLIERLTANGSLRGAREGGRAIGPAGLADVHIADVTDDSRAVAGGSLFVAVPGLHVDGHANPAASGVATYYFGTGSPDGDGDTGAGRGRRSVVGARFADLVQRELTTRTGLLDCRSHPKTWVLLRGWARDNFVQPADAFTYRRRPRRPK